MSKDKGFSLVEVVIALGVISFTLVALLGLMTVSLDSSKSSNENTMVSTMIQTAMSDFRTNSFKEVVDFKSKRFFNSEGMAVEKGPQAYYQCEIATFAHDSVVLPESVRSSLNGLRVRFTFTSLLQLGKTNEVYETTISRY